MRATLEYEQISGYEPYYKWVLILDNYQLSGRAESVRGVYRKARKAARRHQKLVNILGVKYEVN